ncbi:MAG TPA: alpha/beta hydrolase-fold protein [Acidothermaceae bacterium]
MFGPTSWAFLCLLIAGFAGLLYWLARSRRFVIKATSGVLAFALASLFGASLVNQYYAYFTTWGSLFANATGSGVVDYSQAVGAVASSGAVAASPPPAHGRTVAKHGRLPQEQQPRDEPPAFSAPPPPLLASPPHSDVAASITISPIGVTARPTTGKGRVVQLALSGARSGITRQGFVYLPPQYFEPAYKNVLFPVVELFHGDPGNPTGWIYALHLPQLMDSAIDTGDIGPMVIVMPATFDGAHGQDCVDAPHGQLDDTYLSADVPADVMRDFRVLPQGPHWAIGGLSDGGFCAANLALRHPGEYGAVASMDGFYSAYSDLAVMNKMFGAGASAIAKNDPSTLATDVDSSLPRFWLMSGSGSAIDTVAAQDFREIVETREQLEYAVLPGGKHTPPAWRAALPPLLAWTWQAISGGHVGVGTSQLSPASRA